MKTILITGASGFIGSYLRKEILKEGHRVVALSRVALHESSYENEIWIQGDLSNPLLLGSLLSSFNIDACVHLAWEGIPDYSYIMSWKNLQYGMNLLTLCGQLHIGHIIIAGSCWEYKEPVGCIDECWVLDDSNHFKAAKNSLRMISHAFCKEQKIHLNWLRPFYVYGPGQKAASLIPYLKKEFSEGRYPQLNAAYNENDFVHVEDVARAISEVINKRPDDEIFNIGSGYATRVLDILFLIAESVNMDIPEGMYCQKSSAVSFYADISKISQVCNWKPSEVFRI